MSSLLIAIIATGGNILGQFLYPLAWGFEVFDVFIFSDVQKHKLPFSIGECKMTGAHLLHIIM